jgi:hypothetical protein
MIGVLTAGQNASSHRDLSRGTRVPCMTDQTKPHFCSAHATIECGCKKQQQLQAPTTRSTEAFSARLQCASVQHSSTSATLTSNSSSDGSRRLAGTIVLFEDLPGSSKRCVQRLPQHLCVCNCKVHVMMLQWTKPRLQLVRGWDSHPTTTAEQHGVRAQ